MSERMIQDKTRNRSTDVSSKPVGNQADWRLFTQNDFRRTLGRTSSLENVSYGPHSNACDQQNYAAHVYCEEDQYGPAIQRLKKHVNKTDFEHGKEKKIPRGNKYRPYRLSFGESLVALIALKASEAFNLCEVDVFLTTEIPDLQKLESTRAALLFAFSDAAKNSGSMAIQFTRKCAPDGVPTHVLEVASACGVQVKNASRGLLAPNEVRNMYLRLLGFDDWCFQQIVHGVKNNFFSPERLGLLVAKGVWSLEEASFILRCSPYPEFVFGEAIDATNRHLYAHGDKISVSAVLANTAKKALSIIDEPLQSDSNRHPQNDRIRIPWRVDSQHFAMVFGPFPEKQELCGWRKGGLSKDDGIQIDSGQFVLMLPRPRAKEEIRVFASQDLAEAHQAAHAFPSSSGKPKVLLVYPSDFNLLSSTEQNELMQYAKRSGLQLLVAPISNAMLQTESQHRIKLGRTVRQ